jgi:hypothetical protein
MYVDRIQQTNTNVTTVQKSSTSVCRQWFDWLKGKEEEMQLPLRSGVGLLYPVHVYSILFLELFVSQSLVYLYAIVRVLWA